MEKEIIPFKKEFVFTEYTVELTHNSLTFINKLDSHYRVPSNFENSIDSEKDGGKIHIRYKDKWGSEMQFIHYFPSDLNGMFKFIGYGYFRDNFERMILIKKTT